MITDSASSLPPESFKGDRSAARRKGSARPGWLLPTLLILLWAYAVYRLGTLWHSNKDYSYGWFVPVLCLALFWERWKSRPAPEASRPASGTFLLLGAFGLGRSVACSMLVSMSMTLAPHDLAWAAAIAAVAPADLTGMPL